MAPRHIARGFISHFADIGLRMTSTINICHTDEESSPFSARILQYFLPSSFRYSFHSSKKNNKSSL